jgi:hypothetical protein
MVILGASGPLQGKVVLTFHLASVLRGAQSVRESHGGMAAPHAGIIMRS